MHIQCLVSLKTKPRNLAVKWYIPVELQCVDIVLDIIIFKISNIAHTDWSCIHRTIFVSDVVVQFFYIIMAVLRSRCGHYIFALCFISSVFLFLPRLISAVADWMCTILPHMVWP